MVNHKVPTESTSRMAYFVHGEGPGYLCVTRLCDVVRSGRQRVADGMG
jgi:hypothetical protein